MKLASGGAVEMLHTATQRKTDILRQRAELTKQAEETMRTLKAAMITRDELLAEKARLDEALKDAEAMAQVAEKIVQDETISIDEGGEK